MSGNLSQNGELIELYAPDGATNISFTYDNDWYSITNTGRYLVAVDLSVPQTDAYWSTAPAWRPSATSNAVPGHAERPLITAPRLDTQGQNTLRFDISNLDGLWLDVFYSPDLINWQLLAPSLFTLNLNTFSIDLTQPGLSPDRGFFKLHQQ